MPRVPGLSYGGDSIEARRNYGRGRDYYLNLDAKDATEAQCLAYAIEADEAGNAPSAAYWLNEAITLESVRRNRKLYGKG